MLNFNILGFVKSKPTDGFPNTSFPTNDILDNDLIRYLRNSDPSECNQNLSVYMKTVVDLIGSKDKERSYHELSVFAMKLLMSNLFVKNYRWCLGKILSLLQVFTGLAHDDSHSDTGLQDQNMQELICVILYLVLKIKNSQDEWDLESEFKELTVCVDVESLYDCLREFKFMTIISNFVASQITRQPPLYVLLKFCCDIIFEYLFHIELLTDTEFDDLIANTTLISVLINHLLANNFREYEIQEDWENEDHLISYEEFKLLLLINEQYLMKSYTSNLRNKVFDELMDNDLESTTDSINHKISVFMNLLVFHLNREESQIIKILILKFLYLIFTSSYTSKLYYLNDLKILVDIFVRELNDLPYTGADKDNQALVITYLKVLYPMMTFSQLSELPQYYKREDINEMLHQFINGSSEEADPNIKLISDLANRCLTVPWLKKKKSFYLQDTSNNSSNDSLAHSFTKVASVRSSSRDDYYLHTIVHNNFKAPTLEKSSTHLLALPHEYLNTKQNVGIKNAPPPPPPKSPYRSPSPFNINKEHSPKPPPPPPRRRR